MKRSCMRLKGQLAFVLRTTSSLCHNNETKSQNNGNYKWLQEHLWRRLHVLCIKHPYWAWSVWNNNARLILYAKPMQYLTCLGKVPSQIQEKALFHFSFTSIPVHSRIFHLRNIYIVSAPLSPPAQPSQQNPCSRKLQPGWTTRTPSFHHISPVPTATQLLHSPPDPSSCFSPVLLSTDELKVLLHCSGTHFLLSPVLWLFLPLLLFLSACFTFSIVLWLFISA